jgi:antitoxin YobK
MFMGMEELQEGIAFVNLHPELADFMGNQDEGIIVQAEILLQLRFPPTYRQFLMQLGAGSFGAEEFYGITSPSFQAVAPDAIGLTLKYREQWDFPHSYVYIYNSGDGIHLVIDTSQLNAEAEYPILIWQSGSLVKEDALFPDFGTFFKNAIQEAAEE